MNGTWEKTRSSETIVQKMTLIFPGTFGKVRFNVARSLWMDHLTILQLFQINMSDIG